MDDQIRILEVLDYATLLPARPVEDILTPGKVYYSPTMANLLGRTLTTEQVARVTAYLDRIDKIEAQENDAIERMSALSVGRGDVQFAEDEPAKLRSARFLCGERIREILGLPDKWAYYAEYR